jgi:hypothetical protein
MYNRGDRARRGASGALWPTIRSSGVEFPAEASLFLVGALARGVEGWGPARRAARELRQDRKVAAATGWSLVRQSTSPEPAARDTQGECCRSRVHGRIPSLRLCSGIASSSPDPREPVVRFPPLRGSPLHGRGSSRRIPSPPREGIRQERTEGIRNPIP